jgi:predicted PurR-regulated permease PerM
MIVDTRVEHRQEARNDLARAIAIGGIGIVLFVVLLVFTWAFAKTLFLIFAGVLLGVAFTALSNLLGRVTPLPHGVCLAIICLALLGLLAGIIFLGGTAISEQATALSETIKSQIGHVRDFLDRHGIDTSYFDFGSQAQAPADSSTTATTPGAAMSRGIPDAGALASSGEAIISRAFKFLLGTVSAVGNFFIVIFLGLAFAAQPEVYRRGLLFVLPARHHSRGAIIVDRIGETLERWLIAQMIIMSAVFLVTWIGLAIIGIPSSFILGVQAGLLAFIPTVGALLAGLIVVLASLASGWLAALSALGLFVGVHVMESYVLTPLLQRQALEIPPATLFAFQILLGTVFGVWGLAMALPLMAIAKVIIEHFKAEPDEPAPAPIA